MGRNPGRSADSPVGHARARAPTGRCCRWDAGSRASAVTRHPAGPPPSLNSRPCLPNVRRPCLPASARASSPCRTRPSAASGHFRSSRWSSVSSSRSSGGRCSSARSGVSWRSTGSGRPTAAAPVTPARGPGPSPRSSSGTRACHGCRWWRRRTGSRRSRSSCSSRRWSTPSSSWCSRTTGCPSSATSHPLSGSSSSSRGPGSSASSCSSSSGSGTTRGPPRVRPVAGHDSSDRRGGRPTTWSSRSSRSASASSCCGPWRPPSSSCTNRRPRWGCTSR